MCDVGGGIMLDEQLNYSTKILFGHLCLNYILKMF